MELKYIFYITVNVINGKFYFGVHETNPETFDGYIGCGIYRQSNATKDHAFHRAVRKYGYENFKRTTIQIFPHTKEGYDAAYALETEVVTEVLLRSKTCYNTALGGRGGATPSTMKTVYMFDLSGNFLRSFKTAREAARYLQTDNENATRAAIKNVCQGKAQSSNGYYWSYTKKFEYYSFNKIVAQYTLDGKFIRTFKNVTEAEVALQTPTIYQAISKGYSSAGYQWKLFNGSTENIPKYISTFNKNKFFPILMCDLNSNTLHEYESVKECVKANPSLSMSQINRVLKNIIKSHKGYTFKYKDEDIVSLI